MIDLYIANLGKYNEGELVGEWLTLPCEVEEIVDTINTVLVNPLKYEEVAIHDYETDLGLTIGEYDNIFKMNELLKEVNEYDKDLLGALIRNYGLSLEEGISALDNTHYIQLDTNTCMSDSLNIAYSLEESIGSLVDMVGKDRLSYYFDWEGFGRDLSYDLDMILEGLEEEEKAEYYNMNNTELAEWYIFECLGRIEELGQETLERYFDYEQYGNELLSEYTIDHETMIATSDY